MRLVSLLHQTLKLNLTCGQGIRHISKTSFSYSAKHENQLLQDANCSPPENCLSTSAGCIIELFKQKDVHIAAYLVNTEHIPHPAIKIIRYDHAVF